MFGLPTACSAIHYIPDITVSSASDLLRLTRRVLETPGLRAQAGDLITTAPEEGRYRNDQSYVWDGQSAVPWVTDIGVDDYGFCSPTLTVGPGQPINLYCNLNAHNQFWWPSSELRELVIAQPPVTLGSSGNAYRDVHSNGKTFRFFTDRDSDLSRGIYAYHPDEYESRDGLCTMTRAVVPYDYYFIMTDDYVVCSVLSAPTDIRLLYDSHLEVEDEDMDVCST